MGDIKTAKHVARVKQGGAKHAKPVDHSGRFRKLFAVLGVSISVVVGISGYLGIQSAVSGEDVHANALPAGAYASKSVDADSATPEVGDGELHGLVQASSVSADLPPTAQEQQTGNANLGSQDNIQSGSTPSQSAESAEAHSGVLSDTDEEAQGSQTGNGGVEAQENANGDNPDEAESHDAESGAQDTSPADDGGANADGSAKEAEAVDPESETAQGASELISEKVVEQKPVNDQEAVAFFASVIENGAPMAQSEAKRLADEPVSYSASVEPMYQAGLLDSGCEIVSLCIALKSMGVEADPVAIAEDYIEFDSSIEEGFVGDPYSGGGAFPSGVAKAANAYLSDRGLGLRAYDLTGNSFDVVLGMAERGYPVLVWTTMDMSDPLVLNDEEEENQWYANEHCVVVYGVSEGQVLVSDPLEGLVERDAERFAELYGLCGSMALIVR